MGASETLNNLSDVRSEMQVKRITFFQEDMDDINKQGVNFVLVSIQKILSGVFNYQEKEQTYY